MPAGPADIQIFSQHETLRLQRENDALSSRCLRVEAALKQRLSRYELPEELRLELRLEHSAGEHDAFDAFDDRYRGMARRLDQHIKDHLPRYVDRNAYERYIDHMDVDIFASTELELGRFSDCIGRELLELSKCSAFSKHQGSALARRFHMVAWSRMTMYEEDVDSERMHLDEGFERPGLRAEHRVRRDSTKC